MYWINFLHIYQPTDQSREILKRVVNESYRPLFKGLLITPGAKINLNINGALTELLIKEGYGDVIENIKRLAENKKLEFTESAKYHTLLPFLRKEEMSRQIKKNNQTNKKYFGKTYRPTCFFPPEMAYSRTVGEVVSDLGYSSILLDEIAFAGGESNPPYNQLLILKGTEKLMVIFRERRISNCVMSAIIRSKKEFVNLLGKEVKENKYLCTAMDGETFGHHRPGLENTLFKILDSKTPKQIFLSELPKYFKTEGTINPLPSTWASSQEDIKKGIQFYSWKDPKNKVHQLQWQFFKYVSNLTKGKKHPEKMQDKIDKAMASDQFFWASGEPWWSIEMIEKGAWNVLKAFKNLPGISDLQIKKGQDYYKNIVATAFKWQRSGKIEALAKKYKEAIKIPFKERTLDIGGKEVYKTIISLMEKEMLKAAKKKNYEKAILWRDGIWKLETKNDIYDMMHIVDLLRMELPEKFKKLDPQLNELFGRYKEKYKKIQPGQPEIRRT